jgi:hypothetical protein
MAWFKWKKPEPDTEEIKAVFDLCVEVFKRTWRGMQHQSLSAAAAATEMEEFAETAFQFVFDKFPIMQEAPPHLLWLAVFKAVLDSKTYPAQRVSGAIDLLREKYVPSPWQG